MSTPKERNVFVQWLEAHQEDRAMLAALRRGLGQPPGTVANTFRYVVPFIPNQASRSQESVYYLIASLYALHPQSVLTGNLGQSFAELVRKDPSSAEAVERRFTALLGADIEDLDFYLRQAIAFLKSKEIAVNWDQLFRDIQQWDSPTHYVQRQWAYAFWRRSEEELEKKNKEK